MAVDIIISMFFFPVLLLLVVQIKNILVNKTTYEQIRGKNSSVKDQLKGRGNKNYLKNCRAMCGESKSSFSSTSESFHQDLLSED